MIKILIVDDEKIIRETISQHIPWNTYGIEVIGTASNGLEAFDIIMDEYPDIVMTDIKMPGLTGLELLQRIKKLHADVEFIILSGYGEFQFAKEAMQWGVQHYLLKPCNEEQIIQSVQAVMEDISQKKAYRDLASSPFPLHNLDSTSILNMINECVAMDAADGSFEDSYSSYRKFLDFDSTPYELCFLYFVDEAALREAVSLIQDFRLNHAPGVCFHTLYVHQTLLFFFRSYHLQYHGLDTYMEKLSLHSQSISCTYKRLHYDNLSLLLQVVISKIKRYETIYYDHDGSLISICNYRSIIRDVENMTRSVYTSDPVLSKEALDSLLELLSQITNPVFLKQLISSVVMLSSSKCLSFSALEATEFLLEINTLEDTGSILHQMIPKMHLIAQEYHAEESKGGSLSSAIEEYVQQNLSDSNLSLKWIAENYLYMNVDYVSKRFLKETGQKFSNYLTVLRIQRAKELLTGTENDKIQSIAELIGCGNNPQYFSQLFKKATGMTPSAYIKFISGGKQDDK